MKLIISLLILLLNTGQLEEKISGDKFLLHSESLKPSGIKILLFITSMSCECTLKMCAEYEQALRELENLYEEEIDFEIIDSYLDEKQTGKYQVSFVPAIIFLDKENKELKRIIREEDIEIQLNDFLQTYLGEIK